MQQQPRRRLTITKPGTQPQGPPALSGLLGASEAARVCAWEGGASVVSVIGPPSPLKSHVFALLASTPTTDAPVRWGASLRAVADSASRTVFLDAPLRFIGCNDDNDASFSAERASVCALLCSGASLVVCAGGAADGAQAVSALRELDAAKQSLARFLLQSAPRRAGSAALLSDGPALGFVFPCRKCAAAPDDEDEDDDDAAVLLSETLRRARLIPADASSPTPLLCPRQRSPIVCQLPRTVVAPSWVSVLADVRGALANAAAAEDEARKLLDEALRRAFGHQQRPRWSTVGQLRAIDAVVELLGDRSMFFNDVCDVLRAHTRPVMRYSLAMCTAATEVAREHYFASIPPTGGFSRVVHEASLARAEAVFRSLARGPAVSSSVAELRAALTHEWISSGRQLCEAVSLSGRPCKIKHSRIGDSGKHSSECTVLRTCFCGRRQSQRLDAFTLEEEHLNAESDASECCNTLPHLSLPFVLLHPLSSSLGVGIPEWRLTMLGSAAEAFQQARNVVLRQPGFVQGLNVLHAVEMARPAGRCGGDAAIEETVHIGFEYECEAGHRFIPSPEAIARSVRSPDQLGEGTRSAKVVWRLAREQHQQQQQQQQPKKRKSRGGKLQQQQQQQKPVPASPCGEYCPCELLREMIDCWSLPLFLPCQWCKSQQHDDRAALAQLQREFIVTPPRLTLAITPNVVFESTQPHLLLANTARSVAAAASAEAHHCCPRRMEYGPGARVLLPANTFLVLRFPSVYPLPTSAAAGAIVQTAQDVPFSCTLTAPHLHVA